MDEQTYIINFDNVSPAEANRYAEELRNILLNASRNIKVERRREEAYTQDFGATLVAILGTAAVTAAVKALGNWLQLRNSASITLKDANGQVIAKNLTSKDAARLTELFLNKK